MVGAVLLIMVGKTVRAMQGVGWLPITPLDVDLPFWAGLWFGIFPTLEVVIAQVLAAAFVIGSYFAAERMRKGRPGPAVPGRVGADEIAAADLEERTPRRPPSPPANGNGNGRVPDAVGVPPGRAGQLDE